MGSVKSVRLPPRWDPREPLVLHGMGRAVEGRTILADAQDEAAFERFLRRSVFESQVELLGYCPNGNHYHVLVFATAERMGVFMHRLHVKLTAYARAKYGGRGHVLFRPYAAYPKFSATGILDCSAYVHANRYKDGRPEGLFDFRRSSLRAYCGIDPMPDFVAPDRVLGLLRAEPGTDPHEAYRRYIVEWASARREVVARAAALVGEGSKVARRDRLDAERLGSLVSLSHALSAQAEKRAGRNGVEAWRLVAAELAKEGASLRVIGALVRRSHEKVRRSLGVQILERSRARRQDHPGGHAPRRAPGNAGR